MTTVSNISELQQRSEELQSQGYEAVLPGAFCTPKQGGSNVFSWGEYVHQKLTASATMTGAEGNVARREISAVFGSSGGENKAKPEGVGTPGLGFMEWGVGNRLPNLVYLLSKMSPFPAAGVDFVKKILVGRGPSPKYHYTQYVGGNITEKSISYASAGTLLRGQIADLKAKEKQMSESENQTSELDNKFTQSANNSENEDSEEMKSLKAALEEWKRTNKEMQEFIKNNDLHKTYLEMAGDMSLMSQCFCELQLNQRQLDSDGRPVPTSQWNPKIVGIKPRSVFTTRLERMDSQYRINYAYLANQWLDSTQTLTETDRRIVAVPYLAADTAVADLNRHVREARQQRVSRKNRPTRFIMSPRDFGGPYYADAMWHSIFAGSIFEYAFTIIDDRLTRKRNSNIIGRVIYIHQEYLKQLYTQQGENKSKTMAQIQKEVFSDINTWLSNPDNAGQALISATFTGLDGKEHKAWEIVEIETKANSQAQAEKTELQEISSIIFFAMGLDSKLIGNTPGDATSSGGTDLRERFLVKQIQFAPLQQLMLRPLEVISKFNGWDPHLVWQIDREVLTTLDNSKTGVTKQE